MITTYKHKGLKELFEEGKSKHIAADLTNRLKRLLDFLNRAVAVTDMNLPGFRLHELKGERKGTWAVNVGGNWRLTFKFAEREASDVDLEDYH